MNSEQDKTGAMNVDPESEADAGEATGSPGDNASTLNERRALTSEDFLVPGPSPQSNEGLGRWGLTWLAFSLLLILMMLCLSFVCLTLANWTGIA